MKEVFADTNYLVALLDPKDNLHDRVCRIMQQLPPVRIVTTDFVLMEMLRLFSDNGERFRQAATETAKRLRASPNAEVIPASRNLFDQALNIYALYHDKQWDVVDCASYVIMKDRGIDEALTHDVHFTQMGFHALLRDA